jgi:predicted TIM-barrel fold metal-dependent hydrolase
VTVAKQRVISADCHINEPPWVFETAPARFKNVVPKLMRGADGGDGWSFDGRAPKRTLGVEATAGRESGAKKLSGLRFDEILPGNYDGAAHQKDMQRDGIDVSIVYPANAIHVYLEEDRELALALVRAYNDWVLAEFQAAAPQHLVGLPMLPVDDGMDACLAELNRVQQLGARGAFIPGFPRKPYHDRSYDPLYARCSEARFPLTFHRTFGGRPAETDFDELVEQKITTAGTVYRFFSAVKPLTYMILGGVFDRHPELRIVAAEVNFGWIPFWAQTLEQNSAVRAEMGDASAGGALAPTEYLGRNVFVTVLDDHVGFGLVKKFPWLADVAMYSTDYPHSVTLWPRTRELIPKLTKGLPKGAREKILAGNAERVYGI